MAQAHLETCEARRSPEALMELLATAVRQQGELREQLNEAEALAAGRQTEKLFLEAEITDLKEKIVRETQEHDRVASALRKEVFTMKQMKSVQTARLNMLEEKLVEDRRLLSVERAEQDKKIKDLQSALEEKDKDLKRAARGGERRQRHRKHSSTRRDRDVSKSPRRCRRRSVRGRTPIRRKPPAGQVRDPAPPTCAPPCFAPFPPFSPFGDWKGHAGSFGSSFMGTQQGAL